LVIPQGQDAYISENATASYALNAWLSCIITVAESLKIGHKERYAAKSKSKKDR